MGEETQEVKGLAGASTAGPDFNPALLAPEPKLWMLLLQ